MFRWLRSNKMKVLDLSDIRCLGPTHMIQRSIKELSYGDLCDGQWASFQNLADRVQDT